MPQIPTILEIELVLKHLKKKKKEKKNGGIPKLYN